MKVLMTTRGSSGHIGPLVPFGQACVRAGREVTVAAQRQFAANIDRSGAAVRGLHDDPPKEVDAADEQFAALDIATANEVMVGQFFAGIDVAELPGQAIRAHAAGRDRARELGVPAPRSSRSSSGSRSRASALGLVSLEEQTIELAAASVDDARAALGLPSDPRGERLRDAVYLVDTRAARGLGHDGAVADPPVPLRGQLEHRAASGLVARRRGPPRLPDLQLHRPAGAHLPTTRSSGGRPLTPSPACRPAARHRGRRRARRRRARRRAGQRPRRDPGCPMTTSPNALT